MSCVSASDIAATKSQLFIKENKKYVCFSNKTTSREEFLILNILKVEYQHHTNSCIQNSRIIQHDNDCETTYTGTYDDMKPSCNFRVSAWCSSKGHEIYCTHNN